MKTNLILLCVVGMNIAAFAGEKMSDAETKQKLLGYWSSPRHVYHIESEGIIYMSPRKDNPVEQHWNVKDGKFYWFGEPHTIVTLNNSKFVYREIGGHGTTYTFLRETKEALRSGMKSTSGSNDHEKTSWHSRHLDYRRHRDTGSRETGF